MKLKIINFINKWRNKNFFNINITQQKIIILIILILVFLLLMYYNPIMVIEAWAEEKTEQKNMDIEEIIKELQELKEKQELAQKEIKAVKNQVDIVYDLLYSVSYALVIQTSALILAIIIKNKRGGG